LLRESLISGVLGLAFVVSAAFGRPLLYLVALAALGKPRPNEDENESMMSRARAELKMFARDPRFARMMNVLTAVFGAFMIVETALKVYLVFTLTPERYLLLGPVVRYSTAAVVIVFVAIYAVPVIRRLRREDT